MRRIARRVAGPFGAALVVGVALLVGSGVLGSSTSNPYARALSIERNVKCPELGCGDLSIVQSEAPASIALRDQIVSDVRAGRSDSAIYRELEQRFGTAILLSPPPGGIDTLLWLVPVLGVVVVLVVVAVLVVRRRHLVHLSHAP